MDCRYLDELYELFLLGLLKAPAAAEIQEHVERECPYCLEHLREAAQAVYLLISSAKPRKPGPGAKAELLRRLPGK